MPRIGIKGQTYLNTGTHAAPIWNRCKFLRDVTMEITSAEAAVKNKGSMFIKYLSGLVDVPLDFEGDWEPGNPVFNAMQKAFWSKEPLEFMLLDGGIKKVGAQGLRGGFAVTKFGRSEPLEEAMSLSASLRLHADYDEEPAWVVVGEGAKIETVGEFGDDPDNDP